MSATVDRAADRISTVFLTPTNPRWGGLPRKMPPFCHGERLVKSRLLAAVVLCYQRGGPHHRPQGRKSGKTLKPAFLSEPGNGIARRFFDIA